MLDLSTGINRLSLAQQRAFHVSSRSLAGINLHAPTDPKDKLKGAALAAQPVSPSRAAKSKTATRKGKPEKENADDDEDPASMQRRGSLAPNSIFADEAVVADENETALRLRDTEAMAKVLDPRPRARALWQRKMLVRSLQRRGRMSKQEVILQTERSHLAKSHFFKTSIKKLAPLARQIAGKTIDEAILQMRFSKKKVAQDVRAHLIHARNEAIVIRGMGLGAHVAAKPVDESETVEETIVGDPSTHPFEDSTHIPTLKLQRGVTPAETQIYIAQAWVNRGPYGREMEPRARGQVNILRPPNTGLSVLLKEEKTRLREKAEKEMKDRKKRLGSSHWRQLPDRKIYAQRPYYSW